MTWTFNGIPFEWLRQAGEGNTTLLPTWKRQPILNVRPYVGDTGRVAVDRVGYSPWQITEAIFVEQADAAALADLNGASGTISDGVLDWQAVASFGLDSIIGPDGATGAATFTRLQ
jgi:hypothetical protein